MGFHWIDWTVVIGFLFFITYTAITAQKHTRSVADFLAANRCAGRYLLGTAEGMAGMGAIAIVSGFEIFTRTGITNIFWSWVSIPIAAVLVLTGFVVYRFRATRAMTMAQFFEMRYSRKFRIFSGILGWVSGVINFGIFPSVGARFFISFIGFENVYWHIGSLAINLTLALFMLILIGIALFFTFIGGQIAVLVTDFWQGFFATIIFLVIVAFFMYEFSWAHMSEALLLASKPDDSLFNPLDIAAKKDFGFTFFAITWFVICYTRMAWQGTQGYNCSATTPHEAKMSKAVGQLRYVLITVGLTIIPLAALTVLFHPDYADKATAINAQLHSVFENDETLRTQMRIPVALSMMLPGGLMGCFAALMLGFFISTNNTYMHSWGSMLVQDVVCTFRKKPLSPKQHLLYLRLSILFVAVFAFFFGLLYPLKEYIWMFFAITGAIYLGGAGSVIIGGLYWKRATTGGAWTAMIVGSVIAVGTIILRIVWEHIPFLVECVGPEFPYTSQVMFFFSAVTAILSYVIVSLLGKNPKVNMDRMLHRGEYAIKEEEDELKARGAEEKPIGRFWKMIGVNSHEFSKIDKGLFLYIFLSTIWWVGCLVILLILGLTGRMTDDDWLSWWRVLLYIMITVAFIGSIWVSVGGLFDLRKMYKRLEAVKRSEFDDGRVVGDHLLADEELADPEHKSIKE